MRVSGPACALAGPRRCEGCTQGHVKSRVLWRLVEAASFRVVVCWFSACCGVMPPRARWGRRVLYQWIQAAISRLTSPRSAPASPPRSAPASPPCSVPAWSPCSAPASSPLGTGLVALLGPGLVALRRRRGRRAPRRPLRPGAPRGPRRSRKASSGAAPTRCSSSRPRTPSQSTGATNRARPLA